MKILPVKNCHVQNVSFGSFIPENDEVFNRVQQVDADVRKGEDDICRTFSDLFPNVVPSARSEKAELISNAWSEALQECAKRLTLEDLAGKTSEEIKKIASLQEEDFIVWIKRKNYKHLFGFFNIK